MPPGLRRKTNARPAAMELANTVNIPPRPALLMALQREMAQQEPDIKKVAQLINRDVAIAGNLLGMANSAMFNLRKKLSTVEDTILLIGLNHCSAMVTGLLTKKILANGKMMMPRFWDVSEKRAWGMSCLAKQLRVASPATAHNFGLFCDIGIPLMMASFADYLKTLQLANRMETDGFTQLENRRHGINHALVGAMLTEHWGIDGDVVSAIRHHHTPHAIQDQKFPEAVRILLAMHCVVEKTIQEYRNATAIEWEISGASASAALHLSQDDIVAFDKAFKHQFGGVRHA
jgi:HD-like signal output (HDOD) protein